MIPDTNSRDQLTQLIIREFEWDESDDIVSALVAKSADALASAAVKMVHRQTQMSRIPGRFEGVAIRTDFKQAKNEKRRTRSTVWLGLSREETVWRT